MYLFLTLAIFIVVFTITKGVLKLYRREISSKEQIKKDLRFNVYSFIPVLTGLIITAIPQVAHAAGSDNSSGLGFIAAGLSTGLAAIGSGYAVGAVGSSALGAVSEDPKILGKTLIFVGLAEGIAIYGLIISIMILGRL
ncbi:ATP synthase subunit C [Fonticella tunisiensis]|uniref:V/A-type H+-transporting ATPase subunit K n=1 Tax=Fonticella tunisiensis TaxID=1096341 RepID=A0A4R7KBB8_9CLOT|nr:ATP synthase subunit C [Fonticella tunisiensis]TDT50907.1 V/A-type H+-transporting ATPase subunit K [Fonticella tunisiensis]